MRLVQLVILGGFLVQAGVLIAAIDKSDKKADKQASVIVSQVKRQSFTDQRVFPGRIKSKINAFAVAPSEGEIRAILKPIGSKVKKGEAVLTLQNTDPVYNFAPVHVKSPASGYVTSHEFSLMARVEKGQKLFVVTDPARLFVEAEIPAGDVVQIKNGAKVSFRFSQSGPEIPAKLAGLSPIVDIRTGTATAQIEFAKPLEVALQGQLGEVVFDLNERQAFVIPESAVGSKEGGKFVRILEEGKVKKIDIEIAANLGDKIEVKSGLQEGMTLVVRSNRFIRDGEVPKVEQTNEASKTTN